MPRTARRTSASPSPRPTTDAEAAPLHLLPQIWLRNTWAWGRDKRRSTLHQLLPPTLSVGGLEAVECKHGLLGYYYLAAEGTPEILFCDNETNMVDLFGAAKNPTKYTKDGINNRVVKGNTKAINLANSGTKAAFWYDLGLVEPGETVEVRLRLTHKAPDKTTFGDEFEQILVDRKREADEFYATVIHPALSESDRHIARRAYAGLLWGKQLYRYNVDEWIEGDPTESPAPDARKGVSARNRHWGQLALADVISMPDEWEYPWFAAWDLAFHALPLAHVDPDFAKEQLLLMCREWSMHPNGQLPAYEWEFGDVNPPVHAWAAWHVYRIDGYRDREFLIRVFTKLLLNFSWWINRKDSTGSNIFEGGFLGMDNIGLFNRSAKLPPGYRLEQSDATSWMAFYCQQMFKIALELSRHDQAWDEMATKFLEHFLSIAKAMNSFGSHDMSLWHEDDGFFYDVLVNPDGKAQHMRVRSMVGLLPILGATEVPSWIAEDVPDVTSRLRWLQRRRPELMGPSAVPVRTWRSTDAAVAAGPGTAAANSGAVVRFRRIPVVIRDSLAVRRRPGDGDGRNQRSARLHRIRARRIEDRDVRRQLELAGPDLVPGQCAAGRQTPHLRPAFRRLVPDRDPDRFRQSLQSGAGGRHHRPRADRAVPAGERETPGGRRADRGVGQPAVERAPDLLRVLRRRHRRGARRDPPDRLDRAGRAPAQSATASGSAQEGQVVPGFARKVTPW